ncbi:MAG: preprotein translocase subunit SecY [Candidatus Thermoplasmatota archaeon]|jgi:preprotein translocase subunit SecY|nr:preprotein translocase subunit SecY [Candidatus Thermoplasmatota archaeon]MCL5962984.1 preprotein translocase subunit SecY [Candidatus Thermoplasmatota archaeon]
MAETEDGEIERNYVVALPLAIVAVFIFAVYYLSVKPSLFMIALMGITIFVSFGLMFLGLSYKGEKSKLYGLKPVIDRLPAVTKPKGKEHVHFKWKIIWTAAALLLYFALTNIMIFGLNTTNQIDLFSSYRAIMAGAQGTLMQLGIGPIVTGSIIMQLFTGAKIIDLDLEKDEDKAIFQGVQKLLVVVMIFVEAVPQVYGFLTPDSGLIATLNNHYPGLGLQLADIIIIAQIGFGAYIVFLLDEVVSKWGIGSGVSLFIAAGVSQAIFNGTFNWLPASTTQSLSISNPPAGTIPKTIYAFQHINASQMASGGMSFIFIRYPNPIIYLLGTIAVFFAVAYAESTRIELPLSHVTARGARGRYPIKLLYASNIPVILMAALLANVSMFSLLLWNNPSLMHLPLIGHQWWVGSYPNPNNITTPGVTASTPTSGIAFYLSAVNGVETWLLPIINPGLYSGYLFGHSYYQNIAHVLIYFIAMVVGSIIFAKFWIETTNMGPEDVAKQIESSGMQIPGFRRDPRILRKVLERYIPAITIISGAAVGALAAIANLIGTVGNASGTGVLLTVGIIIQFYEAIGQEQLIEMHPVLRGFFGG